MRIVQVNYAYNPDLSDPDALLARYTTLTGWSEALLAAGATDVIVAQRFLGDLQCRRHGVTYMLRSDGGGPTPRPWTRPASLHRMVTAARPDIAHVNGLIFPAQTWLLRRALPTECPIIVQDHANLPRAQPAAPGLAAIAARLIQRQALRAADGFLFATGAHAQAWRGAGLVDTAQIVYEVMESSTAVAPIPRAAARAASGVCGSPAVLWVGRLNANKDPLTVLDAFQQAARRLPDARLAIVYGADDLLPQAQERVRASGELAGRVRFFGRVPADLMPAFYSAADLFVLGSHHEGSGYALIEALACGAVPIVTDIPPFRVLTASGRLGALWPPGDARACAEALIMLGSRNLEPLRASIADHFQRELSWPAVGRRAMAAYHDLVTRRRARVSGTGVAPDIG